MNRSFGSTVAVAQAIVIATLAINIADAQPVPYLNTGEMEEQTIIEEPVMNSGPPMRYGAGAVYVDPKCEGTCAPPLGIGSGLLGGFGPDVMASDDSVLGEPWCDEACSRQFSIGLDFTFLKPHFDSNPALILLESNGTTTDTITVEELGYGTELAPRIWVEMLQHGSLGLRAAWWQFDNSAATASQSPPANGFGRVSTPPFEMVDLSTTVPGSTLTANSGLRAYTFDLEATQSSHFGDWGCMASVGLRYANLDQSYRAGLVNATQATQGTIDYSHVIRGIGPTIAARTQRPFTQRLALFGQARGSLLFGDSTSTLNAIEDQDLDVQLITQRSTARDDLLPIGELMVGLQWTPASCGVWNPYMHMALEGQVWNGAGNASSESGNLGFYGFNFALGVDW